MAVGRHALGDNTTGQIIPMQQEIIHPDWNKFTDEYDFALVVLEYPADVETADIVSINRDEKLPTDSTYARTMGWGDTAFDDEIKEVAESLMAVDVEVISNDDCRQVRGTDGMYTNNYINYIFPSMICTLTPGQDACQGKFEKSKRMNNKTLLTQLDGFRRQRRALDYSRREWLRRLANWSRLVGYRLCTNVSWRVSVRYETGLVEYNLI